MVDTKGEIFRLLRCLLKINVVTETLKLYFLSGLLEAFATNTCFIKNKKKTPHTKVPITAHEQDSHSSPVNHRGVKVRNFRILILFQMRRVVVWRRLRYSCSRRARYSGPDGRRGAGSCIANFLTRTSPLLQKN